MNRITIAILSITILSSNTIFSMEEVIERPLKKQEAATISLKHKVIGVTAVAALLGISATVLGLFMQKFGKFGLAVIAVAQKYSLLSNVEYLQTLLYAKNRDDQNLKQMLMAINIKLFGDNWYHIRSQQVNDYVKMNFFTFVEKYSFAIAKNVATILDLYAGVSDLYFRSSNITTYVKKIPSRKQQVKYMQELDTKLGMVPVVG